MAKTINPDLKTAIDKEIHEERRAELATKLLSHASLEEFIQYLHSPWRIIWTNFLAGVFRGLGFVLGATVVITLVVFVFVKVLGSLPFVGNWFSQVGEFFAQIQEASRALQALGK